MLIGIFMIYGLIIIKIKRVLNTIMYSKNIFGNSATSFVPFKFGIQNLSHKVNKNIGNNAPIEKLEYSDNEDNVIVLNNDNDREK